MVHKYTDLLLLIRNILDRDKFKSRFRHHNAIYFFPTPTIDLDHLPEELIQFLYTKNETESEHP